MKARILETLTTFRIKLWQTPLLLGWLVFGLLLALFQEGWIGLALGLLNLVLGYCWRTQASGRASLANAVTRVVASGVASIQLTKRIKLIATAVRICWRWVLAWPM